MTTFTDHRSFDPAACYDTATNTVRIIGLQLDYPLVVAESRRWTTGERGPSLEPAAMAGADLEPFVRHAVTI